MRRWTPSSKPTPLCAPSHAARTGSQLAARPAAAPWPAPSRHAPSCFRKTRWWMPRTRSWTRSTPRPPRRSKATAPSTAGASAKPLSRNTLAGSCSSTASKPSGDGFRLEPTSRVSQCKQMNSATGCAHAAGSAYRHALCLTLSRFVPTVPCWSPGGRLCPGGGQRGGSA